MRVNLKTIAAILAFAVSGIFPIRGEVIDYDSIVRKYSKMKVEEITALGYKNLEKGNYDEALTLYSIATALPGDTSQATNRREYIKALSNTGYIYLFDRQSPEKAYPYLLKAREMAEREGYSDILAAVLDNIAKVHDDFGDPDKAMEIYNEAMRHAIKLDTEISPVIQLMVFNDLVNCAVAHDMTDKLDTGLEMFSSLPEYSIPMGAYSRKICEGLKALTEKDTITATAIIQNAGRLIDSNVDKPRYLTDHLLTVATLHHMRCRYDSARSYLDNALSTALANQLTDRLPRIYRGMAKVEEARGDSIGAERMLLLAYRADDDLHSSKTYASINTLEASNRIDGLNILLKEESERRRHRSTIIWILSVAMVLIAVLLANIISRNRRLSASLRELVARHQAALNTEEANSRLRHEYEMSISSLKAEIEKMDSIRQTTMESSDQNTEPIQKGMTLPVDENERLRIVSEVHSVIRNSDEIFDSDFSLDRLAELTATKPRYLSALINETMGKTFSQLLAESRVKKACELLLSPGFKKTMTIESIASAVGYKSRTHFTSVFKKTTGVTPLQYVAMAQ